MELSIHSNDLQRLLLPVSREENQPFFFLSGHQCLQALSPKRLALLLCFKEMLSPGCLSLVVRQGHQGRCEEGQSPVLGGVRGGRQTREGGNGEHLNLCVI